MGSDILEDVIVYGEGPATAGLMLIGERPGRQEALNRRPFVGPAGRDLDRYLALAKLHRPDIYITNLVKTFRQYEKPSEQEILEWMPVLQQEIADCSPRTVGLLGTFAVEATMGTWWASACLNVRHGTVWRLPDTGITVVPMYHPAFALYAPDRRKELEHDFRQLAAAHRGLAAATVLGSYVVGENAPVWMRSQWGREWDHRQSDTLAEKEAEA